MTGPFNRNKSPNRNNPTIEKLGVTPLFQESSKSWGFCSANIFPHFFPQVFWGFRKTGGKPYIDYMCVLFKVKKVSMDRLAPVNEMNLVLTIFTY